MANEKCCPNTQIQWYPDPEDAGVFNLACQNCGTAWTPKTAPVADLMGVDETPDSMGLLRVVDSKLDVILDEFELLDKVAPVAQVHPQTSEGGSIYEQAWDNLSISCQGQKSWSKASIGKEMERVLAELQTVPDSQEE